MKYFTQLLLIGTVSAGPKMHELVSTQDRSTVTPCGRTATDCVTGESCFFFTGDSDDRYYCFLSDNDGAWGRMAEKGPGSPTDVKSQYFLMMKIQADGIKANYDKAPAQTKLKEIQDTLGAKWQAKVATQFPGNTAATEHWKVQGTTISAWSAAFNEETADAGAIPNWADGTVAAAAPAAAADGRGTLTSGQVCNSTTEGTGCAATLKCGKQTVTGVTATAKETCMAEATCGVSATVGTITTETVCNATRLAGAALAAIAVVASV